MWQDNQYPWLAMAYFPIISEELNVLTHLKPAPSHSIHFTISWMAPLFHVALSFESEVNAILLRWSIISQHYSFLGNGSNIISNRKTIPIWESNKPPDIFLKLSEVGLPLRITIQVNYTQQFFFQWQGTPISSPGLNCLINHLSQKIITELVQ